MATPKTSNMWIACDLGTSNTCISLYDQNGLPRSINNEARTQTFPSVVYYPRSTKEPVLVGRSAQLKGIKDTPNLIYAAKRLIGRVFEDPIVQQCVKQFPFQVEADPTTHTPAICIWQDGIPTYKTPVDVQAEILKYARALTQKEVEHDTISNIVITVPAYFTHHQRYDTIDAAKRAGFVDVRVINEPSAAAFYSGWLREKNELKTENILVFDFGAGTLDVAIISTQTAADNGVMYKVLATDGNVSFGGFDVDRFIMSYFKRQVKTMLQKKLGEKDPQVDVQLSLIFGLATNLAKIQRLAEDVKKNLSIATQLEESINLLNPTDGEVEEYELNVDRVALSRFFQNKHVGYKLSAEAIQRCLEKAKLKHDNITQIILVGGSTRIAQVPKMLTEIFGGRDIIARTVNADQAVSFGGAIWSASLSTSPLQKLNKAMSLADIAPLSYSIKMLTSEALHDTSPQAQKAGNFQLDVNTNYITKRFINKNALLQKGNDLSATHQLTFTPLGTTASVLLFESDDVLDKDASDNNNNNNSNNNNSDTTQDLDIDYSTNDQLAVNLCLYTLTITGLKPGQQYKYQVNVKLSYDYELFFSVDDMTVAGAKPTPILSQTKLTPLNEQAQFNYNPQKKNPINALRKHSTFQILNDLQPDQNGLICGKPVAYWIKANWEEIPAMPPYWENSVTGDVTYFEEFFDIRNFRRG